MKKILVAFNGGCYPESALAFALDLNKTQPVFLTGVFIPQATYAYLWNAAGAMAGSMFPPLVEEVSSEIVEINKRKFQSFCTDNNIKCVVHNDVYDFALPELVKETRFADLLVLESGKFYESIDKEEESSHLKDLLETTECAVLIVPEKFEFPNKNILAYDGSASSVYAIKQFAYLFPEFLGNETVLAFAKNDEDAELPGEKYIQELANQHYKDLKLLKLNMKPKKNFSAWLSEEKNGILISGSFGRSKISQLFRKSFVAEVIAERQLPVFVAHK